MFEQSKLNLCKTLLVMKNNFLLMHTQKLFVDRNRIKAFRLSTLELFIIFLRCDLT